MEEDILFELLNKDVLKEDADISQKFKISYETY